MKLRKRPEMKSGTVCFSAQYAWRNLRILYLNKREEFYPQLADTYFVPGVSRQASVRVKYAQHVGEESPEGLRTEFSFEPYRGRNY